MARLTFDITMSLDGFIAGPNVGPEKGLGEGGGRLHEWGYGLKALREPHGQSGGTANTDSEVLEEALRSPGAVVMGRGMFGGGEGPFTFVTDGIESALEQARAAAGDRDVAVAGGANVFQQYPRGRAARRVSDPCRPVTTGSRHPALRQSRTRSCRTRMHQGDPVPRRHPPQVPRREVSFRGRSRSSCAVPLTHAERSARRGPDDGPRMWG
jgi:dihydrofolate reductase